MSPRPGYHPELWDMFFSIVAQTRNMSRAARECGIPYGTVQTYRRKSEEFRERLEQALLEYSNNALERCANAAFVGVEEPLYTAKGEPIMEYREVPTGQIDHLGNPIYTIVPTGRQARRYKIDSAQLMAERRFAERRLGFTETNNTAEQVVFYLPEDPNDSRCTDSDDDEDT